MAVLQQRSGSYRILFCHGGKRHTFTVGKVDPREAELVVADVERVLLRLEQRLLKLPPGEDLVAFVRAGGRVPEPEAGPSFEARNFQQLSESYIAAQSVGALEKNSLSTVKIHLAHLAATLGPKFPLASLGAVDLQRHVDRRLATKGRSGQGISPTTIKKELASFRAAWNWGIHMSLVSGLFPSRGLVYPKTDEKPPFQTWEEIERQVRAGGLGTIELGRLWDSLFLTLPEISELLDYVRANANHDWIYAMFAFAAHTGARRSEMLRSRLTDFDFQAGTVLIREKKRVRGKRTTRRVPLSPFLSRVMRDWFVVHPGGVFTICQDLHSRRRKPEQAGSQAVTVDESNDHFGRTLSKSKWSIICGWHLFRHSFASNCAASGIDQRLIDAWLGHTTEEMRRRYRHLLPHQQSEAIRSVFGDA